MNTKEHYIKDLIVTKISNDELMFKADSPNANVRQAYINFYAAGTASNYFGSTASIISAVALDKAQQGEVFVRKPNDNAKRRY